MEQGDAKVSKKDATRGGLPGGRVCTGLKGGGPPWGPTPRSTHRARAILAPSCPNLVLLGTLWDLVGNLLCSLTAPLGRFWVAMWLLGTPSGRLWGTFGVTLGTFGRHCGHFWHNAAKLSKTIEFLDPGFSSAQGLQKSSHGEPTWSQDSHKKGQRETKKAKKDKEVEKDAKMKHMNPKWDVLGSQNERPFNPPATF